MEILKVINECIGELLTEQLSIVESKSSFAFYLNGEFVGEFQYNISYFEDILSEYSDTIDDFQDNIFNTFNPNKLIVNIEDVWITKKYQGYGLFREILKQSFDNLSQYNQFILRAWSDSGFPETKLEEIYNDFGFRTVQDTENDGIIMVKKI